MKRALKSDRGWPSSFRKEYLRERVERGLTLRDELAADLNAATRVRALTSCFARQGDLATLLKEVLEAAIEVTSADFGNVQLLDPAIGALRIVQQHGFLPAFLEYFDQVHDGEAACGSALRTEQRVLVEDVTHSAVFRNPQTIEVLLGAGVRAVQSTPLVGPSGRLHGMISTHYRVPKLPSDRELRALDRIVRLAADFIEWKMQNPIHEARVGMPALT